MMPAANLALGSVDRRLLIAAGTAAAALAVLTAGPAGAQDRLSIVTTIAQIGDLTSAIVGDAADVTILMGEGVDPHSYQHTRTDMVLLNQADVVIYNGLYLEAQMEDLLHHLGERKPVLAFAETLPEDRLLPSVDYEGRADPHAWMNARLWAEGVDDVVALLSEIDPDNAALYAANAEAYLAELDAIADYAEATLATVPQEARVVISAHDAFNYFGDAYGFEVLGIQGLSTESEAGLQQIESMVDLLVEREVGAVFVETSVADRNVQALIEGAAARGHRVAIGGELFSDAMGSAGTYEGTYVGMLDHNVTTITRALGGDAPAGGFQGLLGAAS